MVFPIYPHVISAALLLSGNIFIYRADDIASLFECLKEVIKDIGKQLHIISIISATVFFIGYLTVFNNLHWSLKLIWGIVSFALIGWFIRESVNWSQWRGRFMEYSIHGLWIGASVGFVLIISTFVKDAKSILILMGIIGAVVGGIIGSEEGEGGFFVGGILGIVAGCAIGTILFGLSRITTPSFVPAGKLFCPVKHIFQLSSIPDGVFPLVFALVFLSSLWVIINSLNACIQYIRNGSKSVFSVLILFSICYVLFFSSGIKHFGIFYQNVWLQIFCIISFFFLTCLILYVSKYYGRRLILHLRKKYQLELTFWGKLPYYGFLLTVAACIALSINIDCYGVETSTIFMMCSGAFFVLLLVLTFLPLITPFPYLKWFREKKHARLFWCQGEFMRFKLGNGLPWLVRYSRRWIAREYPAKHKDFKSYFVCRCCGKSDSKEGKKIIGLIGGNVKSYQTNGNDIYVNLWSEREKKARNADIDMLEIRASKENFDYDWAVNAVWIELTNDTSRKANANYVKNIPVVIQDNLKLNDHTMNMLKNGFGEIETV